MQMIINTSNDLEMLQGKFVLQIDSEKPDMTLMDFNWNFVKEKRLKLISNYGFVNLFGNRNDFEDFDTFKKVFNSYLFKHMEAKGEPGGTRFHRLLTSDELQYLFEKIKLENY